MKAKDLVTTGKYILQGHMPIEEHNLLTWGKWFQTHSRRVRLSKLKNGMRISTVFLGLDYSYPFAKNRPLLFETMVFDDLDTEDKGRDLDMQRYSTWDEAVVGHRQMVRKWKNMDTVAAARIGREDEKLAAVRKKGKQNATKN